jgi:PST family polysaccharide transporter
VLVREIARNPGERDSLLGSAFALKATGGALAVLCAALAGSLLEGPGPLRALVVVAALSLLFQAFDSVDLWFQSQLQARHAAIARNLAFLAVALVKIGLIWLEAPLLAFAAAVLLEAALAAAALAAAYRQQRNRILAWRARTATMLLLLRQGWPLLLSGFMVAIYMRIDQVMLGHMAGPGAVGIYSCAVFLSEPLYLAPMAIVASAAPVLAQTRESDPALYRRRLERLFRLMVLLSIAMALPVSLLSGPLVELIFGEAFRDAAGVLAVHAWATLFVALGVASSQYLVLEDLNRISLQRTLVGAVLNVVLNLLWIPSYGALGCAWATLLSYAAASLFLFHTEPSRRCLAIMLRAVLPVGRAA